jgi:RecA/RadA recombinase
MASPERIILPPEAFKVHSGGGNSGGKYFQPQDPLEFIPSGCRLLDCVLGGGWPLSRISNIVGDRSTGKTLLAIEVTNSFMRKYPRAMPKYRESEAAFDQGYAASIGMPIDKIDFGYDRDVNTIEDFYKDLSEYIKDLDGEPGLYILDSLDALSSEAELKRDFNEGSYSMEKAKQMSQLLRRLVRELRSTKTHLMIISQERDNIGVTFGKKSTRSGGRALDFFATHCIWLAKIKTNEQTIDKIKRPVSLDIRAKAEKNKISVPLRQCDFTLRFNFGVDDLRSSMDFLEEVGKLDLLIKDKSKLQFTRWAEDLPDDQYWQMIEDAGDITAQVWEDIEANFMPKRKRVWSATPEETEKENEAEQ